MSDSLAVGHALASFARRLDRSAARGAGPEIVICPPPDFVNLRGDAGDPVFLAAAQDALGQALPTRANTFARAVDTVYWLGPNEWLIESAPARGEILSVALREKLGGLSFAVTVINGGMVALRVSGRGARRLLAKGTTLNLSGDAFTLGDCAQTGLAKASVLLACIDAEPVFTVLVRRSFCDYVALWLEHAGAEFDAYFTIVDPLALS